jgi:hypothetical protein
MIDRVDINALEEKQFLEIYLELINERLNSHQEKIFLVEHPIVSVDKKELRDNQCIPDAILSDETWIEITTFSRSDSMRKLIGDLQKHSEKFEGIKFIRGISPNEFRPLILQWGKAMEKKIIKDYSRFELLANMKSGKGILLIVFVNNDPFFNNREYEAFIENARYEYIYDNFDFSKNCFQKIMFLGFVEAQNVWQCKLETILDPKTINRTTHRIKVRNEIKRFNGV